MGAHCIPTAPTAGKEIRQQTVDQIIDQVMTLPEPRAFNIGARCPAREGEYLKVFEDARRSGYVRARVGGITYDLKREIKLDKTRSTTLRLSLTGSSLRKISHAVWQIPSRLQPT